MSAVPAQLASESALASFEDDERTLRTLEAPIGRSNGTDHDNCKDLEFEDLPPFPTDVPTVPLLRINLRKLIHGEQEEVDRLWQACCEIGFFYLDLRDDHAGDLPNGLMPAEQKELVDNPWEVSTNNADGSRVTNNQVGVKDVEVNGKQLLKDAYRLFGVAEEFFALPVEKKEQYNFRTQGSYHGYKRQGEGVIDKEGRRDRNEFYNTSKDDLLGLSPNPHPIPSVLSPHLPLLTSYIHHSHSVITLILRLLNARLDLPPETLPSLHPLNSLTGDQVRWVLAPSQPPGDLRTALGAHSDFGSVTILFNRLGGLQVLPPNSDEWSYVRPLKGHAVVNLGDAIVKFTAGLLRSNVHRVVSPPGEQAGRSRISLVYFSRPGEEVRLRALSESSVVMERMRENRMNENEESVTSKEWILRRALGRRGNDYSNTLGTEDHFGKED